MREELNAGEKFHQRNVFSAWKKPLYKRMHVFQPLHCVIPGIIPIVELAAGRTTFESRNVLAQPSVTLDSLLC